MSQMPQDLQVLISRLEARERKARRVNLLWFIVPALLGVALLWSAGTNIRQASREVKAISGQLTSTQERAATQQQRAEHYAQQLEKTKAELAVAQKGFEGYLKRIDELNGQVTDLNQKLGTAISDLTRYQEQLTAIAQKAKDEQVQQQLKRVVADMRERQQSLNQTRAQRLDQ